jgi:hypothetical protein
MPIQDNLNGALLISAIDFILSFVIIGGIGVILALFPLLNKFGMQNDKGIQLPSERFVLPVVSPITSQSPQSTATDSIHPGISNQQLMVLLTAAACEALGVAVRVDRLRPVFAKNSNWATQGRHELQSHHLK